MPYNLLLLPICAGYFILVYSVFFKYNVQRFRQRRLLFESIICGIVIVVLAFILRILFENYFNTQFNNLYSFLDSFPILKKVPYLWTVFLGSFISFSLVLVTNLFVLIFYGEGAPILWAIGRNGDELEKLFRKSAVYGKLIQLTLKNDKVYIGFCEFIPEPQKTNYLVISPILSGYRNNITKELVITTDYLKMVDHYIENLDDDSTKVYLNTDITIKQDEILNAGIFEEKIYKMFNNPL